MIFTKNDDSLTVFVGGNVVTIPSDTPNFRNCWEAVKANDEKALLEAIDFMNNLKFNKIVSGDITITADGVFYKGTLIHNNLTDRILSYYSEGAPIDSLVNFLQKFLNNPALDLMNNKEALAVLGVSEKEASERVENFISDFWAFVSHHNLPVTEDGHFLAYKTVRSDMKDKHTGTIDNSVGQVVKLPRDKVNPNRFAECSYGLHVGCLEYAGPNGYFHKAEQGDVCIIVKVNPENVVAVPPDYNRTKMRVCEYEVIGLYNKPLDRAVYTGEANQEDLNADKADVTALSYDLNELYDDDIISFDYKKDGKVSRRHLMIDGFYMLGDKVDAISGRLVAPEEMVGQFRKFSAKNISNIKLHK